MPTPLIDLQRRLTLVGAIRAGGEKEPKRPGRKLEAFRLTSPRRQLVEQAASLYGGSVSPWKSPTGDEWQVYTEAEEIPVLVMPGYSLRQSYELWEGATKRLRLCDGVEEELTGGPCICNAEGVDKCDLYTRLVVALPELDTVLGWRLISRGANAAHELPTMMALLEARGAHTFVPAKLRLDQRRGVREGQVVRFVVPTIDLGVGYLALAPSNGPARALPAAEGFTPTTRREATVAEALAAAETLPTPAPSPRKKGEPIPEPEIDYDSIEAHTPEGEPSSPPAPKAEPVPQTWRPDERMKKKMNMLVGRLREGGHIETKNLWAAVAAMRGMGGEELVLQLGGYDEEFVLHWSPLRDALTRPEAVQLLDRLSALEEKVKAAGASQEPPATVPDEGGQEDAEAIPFNEFPPGY